MAVSLCEQQMLRFFECLQSQIPRNCRETLEEVFQRLIALDVVEQRLGGHAGSPEDGSAVHNLRIPNDRLRHLLILSPTLNSHG